MNLIAASSCRRRSPLQQLMFPPLPVLLPLLTCLLLQVMINVSLATTF
jgi:hypothetical protein